MTWFEAVLMVAYVVIAVMTFIALVVIAAHLRLMWYRRKTTREREEQADV